MAARPLIDEHLDKLAAELTVRGRYRDRVLAELRAHLEDATDAEMARGLPEREAAAVVIAELGSPSELAARFVPQATVTTRMYAGSAALGLILAGVTVRAAGALHADGGRLGSSVLYTVVWAAGWFSLLLLAGPAVALFLRHRGRLGRSGVLALLALLVTAVTGLGFHFTNDGSLRGPDADLWRRALIVSGAAATILLAAMIRRAHVMPRWPLSLIGTGVALLTVHYVIPGRQRGLAGVAGLLLVAAGIAAYGVVLGRERPLA